jgi:hypothetical protein
MSDPRSKLRLAVPRLITGRIGIHLMALLGGCFLIGLILFLGSSPIISAARSGWFSQLESVLLYDGTPMFTGVILWSIVMLFFAGIPMLVGLFLWWITVKVGR